jgi:hypothetical protein
MRSTDSTTEFDRLVNSIEIPSTASVTVGTTNRAIRYVISVDDERVLAVAGLH